MYTIKHFGMTSCLMLAILGGNALAGENSVQLAQAVFSEDRQVSRKSGEELIASRDAIVEELLKQIEEHKTNPRTLHGIEVAIRTLGEMRAVEACEPLSDLILFPDIDTRDMPLETQFAYGILRSEGRRPIRGGVDTALNKLYPAADALAKIGYPSVGILAEKLCSTQNVPQARLCALVIAKVLGAEEAKVYFQERMAHEVGEERRAAIQRALDLLDAWAKEETGGIP